MRKSKKLIELIEQAAGRIKTLSPTDLTELGKLQKTLNAISKKVDKISDGPAQLIEQATGASSKAKETLAKILNKKIKSTARSVKTISKAVSSLQDLIEQIEQPADPEMANPEVVDSETVNTEAADSKPVDSKEAAPEEPETTAEEIVEAEPQEFCIPEDDIPLVLDFVAESNEHIESAEAGLLELEAKSDDKEVLNQIFRSFHTIKGMAGFLNLTEISSLAHSAENLLDLARKGDLVLAGSNTDVIFESIDMLKKLIGELKQAIETGKAVASEKNLPKLLEKLKAAAENKLAEFSIDTPQGKENDETLDTLLKEKLEPPAIQTASVPQERRVSEDRRSSVDRRTGTTDEKIKVSTSRLDNLINMAGELVIAQLMVAEETNTNMASEHDLIRKVVHQSKIVRDLQELSMSMRMVPIAGVFQKMARLIRDLSHKANKTINFVTSGDETELDRNIVDKIADPLVHMVRNSVDHGIESAEDRAGTGKDPAGKLELRAFHQAGNIVIEIEDDGKGLDKERILKKAIDNGLVEIGQELSDEEIFKLIFNAGLSTAQKITSISGRGVGMDVVRKNIEALRGKIEITSTKGKGTTFTIRMPLTLAIIDGQIVTIGNDRYIVPIISIVRSLKPTDEMLSSVQGKGELVLVRGELLPMVRLYNLFGVTPASQDPTESLLIIVEEEGKKCCLLVDELLGQQQVVIKNLGEGLDGTKGVSGGAIMGDGKVSLILDIPGLIELAQR